MTGNDGDTRPTGGAPDPGRTGVSGVELAGAGVQFAVVLVAASFAGMWLDRQLGTSPWLLIVMVFAGAAAAFYAMYRKLMKGQRLGDRRKSSERRERDEA
jgi:F0F1-type ATP synthase assembly protein I